MSKGFAPAIAVEFARRAIPDEVRPGFAETEAACRAPGGGWRAGGGGVIGKEDVIIVKKRKKLRTRRMAERGRSPTPTSSPR